MQPVLDQIRETERRLERLLASGWRNAAGEAADLTADAALLSDLGLGELAALLRRVAESQHEAEALPAISLALASCQALRARLPHDQPPPGRWEPLAPPGRRKAPQPERLLPVSRLPLGDSDVWACIRLRGSSPDELLLLAPPPPPPPAEPLMASLVARLFGKGEPAPAGPWLSRSLTGHLRWQARYPLGATGEIRLCALLDAKWEAPPPAEDELAKPIATLDGGSWKSGEPLLQGPRRSLQVQRLESADPAAYVWPTPEMASAYAAAAPGRTWQLIWQQDALFMVLALLEPAGLTHRPGLIHLGTP